jgi:hypothetical protein
MVRSRIHFLLMCLCAVILLVTVVHADMIDPAITHVYFDKDGVPYNGSVQYTITCYGYSFNHTFITPAPGSYQPQPVFRYSASCNGYGCPIYQQYYLQYTHIDRCSLEGVADNRNFTIQNFSSRPFSRCDNLPERVSRDLDGRQVYFYPVPEFISCRYFEQKAEEQWTTYGITFSQKRDSVNRSLILLLPEREPLYEILPWRDVSINRSDITMDLSQYIAYLEACDVKSDPMCAGFIVDGKSLKSFPEYRIMKKNATYLKDHPCDTFLVEAEPSLIMPFTEYLPWSYHCVGPCNVTGEICEARFTIPSVSDPGNTGVRTTSVTPTHGGSANVHRSPVESLYCTVLSWFKISC